VSAHILIVEDDESIAEGLRINLEAEGYRVTIANDGEKGLALALGPDVDLVVLDVMLPRMNGFEVVRALRKEREHPAVLILSARGAEEDKVVGLDLGAEDYITKPFGLAELFARIKAALRRSSSRGRKEQEQAATTQAAAPLVEGIRFGDVEIDVRKREVSKAGRNVELTAMEFDVLWCLIEESGGVLSREQILAKVWGPGHHGTLRTIDNFLMHLRAKLEDDPAEPRHLLTVRGVGYRFNS
jgi:two-component system, OmpR family, alkaline phosphatase synthesis response regulator PhoP